MREEASRGDEREDTKEQTTRRCFHYSRIKAPPPAAQPLLTAADLTVKGGSESLNV